MIRAELRGLVDEHRAADPTEAGHREAILRLVERFDDPWNRSRFEPGHITASGFVVHPDLSAIALVHHAKLDMWLQPGGHIEALDPSLEAAARREVAEECMISDLDTIGVIDLDIHVFPERGDEPRHLHHDVRWAFVSRTPRLGAGDGALAARWVPLVEARSMDESIARAARKLAAIGWHGGDPAAAHG